METKAPDQFAIIGIGCRMPPNANSLAAFWKFLLRGGNALKALKSDRWDWRQYFDADDQRPGKSYAPKAAFLSGDVQKFDPLAFGISPREAAGMDPQQRLLLEVTWEAFEDAGLPLEAMSGTATGVFVGAFCLDHLIHQSQPSNRHLLNAQSPAGATMTVLSNRLSHTFNLRGPSLTLDTACSSSLVAIHYACQSLRSGESDLALAGGVNVMTRPDFPSLMSKGHFLSPHGECHAFDESAAGYARGEGAGIFLLKPYQNALADGDPIHAVICGSGVNQDGHTDGISLPNSEAQEKLIHQVYQRSGVAPAEVDYVEAHGTGTQAGDPAEARALNQNFSPGRKGELLIGSVKTNIGHLEAAAGVAGMLKAIGVLKFREVPKNLHFTQPNPKIPFSEYCLKVVSATTPLPSAEEKARLFAGVNSFGYGGTNAHILLASAPPDADLPDADPPAPAGQSGLRVVPFSAQSEDALRDLAGKLAFQLGTGQSRTFSDWAHTMAFHRSHLSFRGVALAENLEELREQWIAASTGQPHPRVVLGSHPADASTGLVFVYTGMGPQWWAMGQELIQHVPLVSETLDEIDAIFQPLAGWSLKAAMMKPEAESRMARTEVAQPANFALQVALTRLWESWGIRPAAVVGHSVGEVVAAHVAGVYSLEDALRVSYHRSHWQQSTAGLGAMLAVGLPESEVAGHLQKCPGISIAAVNSFNAVTLSGDTDQLKTVAAALEAESIFHKFLRVEVAYHSPQMDPLREPLLTALANLNPHPARIPLYSTAHGKIIPGEDWTAEYWWHNVREPVRFAAAVEMLFGDGYSDFLEIGPHPVLGNSLKECAAELERNIRCFVSLRRQEPEEPRLLLTAGELYAAGHTPDWRALAPTEGRFLPGPQYPWQRQLYWLESERSKMEKLGLPGSVYLNRSVLGPRPCWEVEINRNYFPFLFDHGVQDQTVFAGMGYIEAALALTEKVHEKSAVVLDHVSFEKVLIVEPAKLQYLLTEHDAEAGRFIISSRVEGEEDSLQRHCRGRLRPQSEAQPGHCDLAAVRARCLEKVSIEAFYQRLETRQLHYGPAFRPLKDIRVGPNEFLVQIDASQIRSKDPHPLHPTLFDAALQAVLYCAQGERLFVPFAFEQFAYFSQPESSDCQALGRLISQTDTQIVADVWLTDSTGQVHAQARHISLQVIDMEEPGAEPELFYLPEWKATPLSDRKTSDPKGSQTLLLAGGPSSDPVLTRALEEALPGLLSLSEAFETDSGFHQDEIHRLLDTEEARARGHLIVLWGSAPNPTRDVHTISALAEQVVGLFQVLGKTRTQATDLTLVTRGAKSVLPHEAVAHLPAAALSAIGLVAQNEFESLRVRSLDLSPAAGSSEVAQILAEIAAGSLGEMAYRNDIRFEKALGVRAEDRSENVVQKSLHEPVALRLGSKGRADSLHFETVERPAPKEGEIEIRLHQAALNYKDILKVEGHIHPLALEDTFWGQELGMEATGIVERCGPDTPFQPGDRVLTILQDGFRSYATIPTTFAVKLPQNLGMDAAAIPVVYLTAYRGLISTANLQAGERVLIHNATGGLGLAAIDIAQGIGAEIFATAGSEEKRRYLESLGLAGVFSSRTLDFGQAIREATRHEGVDVVLGAQTGQAMHVSLGLLRSGGRYIEVGKKDIAEDNDLPLRAFNRNLTFASIDIDRLAQERPPLIRNTLETILKHFADGDFRLRHTQSYPAGKIREAFQEMTRSRHKGKLLIDFSQGDVAVTATSSSAPLIRRDGTYIVTGGTSGFGLTTARWLAEQGAGKIVLVSRSGSGAAGLEEALQALRDTDSVLEVLALDVTDPDAVTSLVTQAGTEARPLRGILHGAMVLDDAMLSELTEDQFRRVFLPKVAGALNFGPALDDPTLPPLDFLVFYSSISAVVGNPGQTNYVAANSLLDALAHSLRNRGLPATSINWGALAESGVVARDQRLVTALASSGITGLGNEQALDALEKILRFDQTQIGAFLIDWQAWHTANPGLANDPRFRELRLRSQAHDGSDAASQIRRALAEASREQRLRALEEHLQEILANTLKMSKSEVPMNRKLNELGVDSLMVLELSLGIKERIGAGFSAMEFLKGPNLQQLAVMAEAKIWNS